jgi:hypothetical protein
MPLKLNKLSDATIQEDIANNQDRVKKFLAADPASRLRSDPIRYSRRLADAALELGLEMYQQESGAAEVRGNLALAGKELLAVLALTQEDAVLSPLEFEKALALAVCFCPSGVYENVDRFPLRKFFVNPESLSFFAVLAQYLDVLRKFLQTQKLDRDAWKKVEAECQRPNAARYDAQLTMAKLNALKSVDAADAALLNQSIATLVEDHEHEAHHGENQRSTRGFLCFPALMFAHLGAAKNLTSTVQSAYLPLHLLNDA